MTKKRFQKLVRAYFTRLNAWGKENGHQSLNMGDVYRRLRNINPLEVGKTRAEWWAVLAGGNTFGVGVKEGM